MNLEIYNFEKNQEEEWYFQMPSWNGDPEDLQLTEGADLWMDLIAKGSKWVMLEMDVKPFEGADFLNMVRKREDNFGGGAIYSLEQYNGKQANLTLWLCRVTAFVFGEIPKRIYFRKVD